MSKHEARMEVNPPSLNRGVESAETVRIRPSNGNTPQVLVDWLSFTFPLPEWTQCAKPHSNEDEQAQCDGDHRTPEEAAEQAARMVADWLGLQPDQWTEGAGRYFYSKRLSQQSVEVLFAGTQPGMGLHVQATGQGCRALEDAGRVRDWEDFVREIADKGGHVTRIDGAVDDHGGLLDMRTIYDAWIDGHATSHYKTMQAQMPKLSLGCGEANPVPETLYFGDPRLGKSGIRIYDKRIERMQKGFEDPGPWIRVEMVAKNEQADELIGAIANRGLVAAITGAIRGKLDFKEPGANAQKTRWQTVHWWDELLNAAEKVRLTRKTSDRTILQKFLWLEQAAAKNLAMVAMAHNNNPTTLNYLLMAGQERLKPSDRRIVQDYLAMAGREAVAS